MQSLGLTLTLLSLTGTFVAIDLSDRRDFAPEQALTQPQRPSSLDASVNALSVMPNSLPGIVVPKADISNGIYAVGSSTDREGLDTEEQDVGSQTNDGDDEADSANAVTDTDTDEDNDFVLI
ncbi:MAG: hypothetical protein ABIZ64_04235 [Casimicrobium sp.]